jgi:shikimate dehydrogenase
VLKSLAEQGFSGVNLTVPHKEAALMIVDEVEPLAQRIGAINLVLVQKDGTLLGRNTDAYGFTQNLMTGDFKPFSSSVTLLGAGGAARAALAALLDMGFDDIRIMNRTRDKAAALAKEFAPDKITDFAWGDPAALKGACLLANATSLGLTGQPPLVLNLDGLPPWAWVTDMVYAPLETALLKAAKVRRNQTIDGLGMLLHQARPSFAAFFGQDPDVTDDVRAHVLEAIA